MITRLCRWWLIKKGWILLPPSKATKVYSEGELQAIAYGLAVNACNADRLERTGDE